MAILNKILKKISPKENQTVGKVHTPPLQVSDVVWAANPVKLHQAEDYVRKTTGTLDQTLIKARYIAIKGKLLS